jgi:hypothetical protein
MTVWHSPLRRRLAVGHPITIFQTASDVGFFERGGRELLASLFPVVPGSRSPALSLYFCEIHCSSNTARLITRRRSEVKTTWMRPSLA